MGIFMLGKFIPKRRPNGFHEASEASFPRPGSAMNVLSWINEINSSRLYGVGHVVVVLSGGWIFFFFQASNWIDLKEFFEIFRKKTLEGHVWSRLVTFFFCFPPSLDSFEHFSGLLLRNHGACPPKKVIRIIEIVTLCFCSRNSQEVGTLLKPVCFFSQTDFPKKSKTTKRIVPRIHALDLPPTGNSHHQDRKHF